MSKKIMILFLAIMIFLLTSCGKQGQEKEEIIVGNNISFLPNVELDYANAFFDDFTNGVNKDNWYIGDQAWGTGNGGVIPENIQYTDDGQLIIVGNGGYYYDNDIKGVGDVKDGRFTGGALISKFTVQSGHYEVKMKVLPRLGACSAFWTFAYDLDKALNHEIDIELPGGSTTDMITFENVLNTNYITESARQSQDTKVQNVMDNQIENYLNDGQYHVYGFDWYTDPEQVVYYVDGKIVAISNVFVPSMESRLWLGCWFPVSTGFVGEANFESDCMFVDYVTYIPFKNQPVTPFSPTVGNCALDNEYPSTPVSIPTINKVSNGDFENLTLDYNSYGAWKITKRLGENKDKEAKDLVTILDNGGYEDSKVLAISDSGICYQLIDAVYHNFSHSLSFYAKGEGKVTIRYYGALSSDILETKTINVNSETLDKFFLDLCTPENAQSMRITMETTAGNTLYVDHVKLELR